MSVQFAMMGMMVAGAVMQGMAQKKAGDAQADALHSKGNTLLLQEAENDLRTTQGQLAASQKEGQIRRNVLSILSTNEAAGGNKGIALEGGTSFDVLQRHNVDAANEDIKVIQSNAQTSKVIGDARGKMLSFAAQDAFDAGQSSRDQATMQMIGTIVGGLGKAGSSLGSWGSGGGELARTQGVDPRDEARGA